MPDGRRGLGLAVVAVAAVGGSVLLGTGTAQAATGVTSAGGTLRVSAQAGKVNKINVALVNGTFTVTDTGDVLTPGTGCTAVNPNSVQCTAVGINRIVINAGDLDDTVTSAAPFATTVLGAAGNDRITTGIGADQIDGGLGADVLIGGAGDDTVNGGDDGDRLVGNEGRDTFDGGRGADLLEGGPDRDMVTYAGRSVGVTVDLDGVADDGEPGENDNARTDLEEIAGGSGNDVLTGTDDPLVQNRLLGNLGDDTLNGLAGRDLLFAHEGKDTLNGGANNDELDGGPGPDRMFGGADNDEVSYAQRTARVTADLDGAPDDGETGEGDTVGTDVEDLTGGKGGDVLKGNGVRNVLLGNDGGDDLYGGGGDDALFGLGGGDRLFGDGDNDTLQGGPDHDTLQGGTGRDHLNGGDGDDELSGNVNVFGGGRDEPDNMIGGLGDDMVDYFGAGGFGVFVSLDGVANDGASGEGDNVQADVENITGSTGPDVLTGNEQANVIAGLNGTDQISGLAGNDSIDCGLQIDSADGGADFDTAVNCETTIHVP